MNFIYFLGRFHVLVLHLPVALVLVTVLAEWLSRREKHRYLQPALGFLWATTALTAVATVALGYMHFSEGGFTGPSATWHRFFGTSVAIVATGGWLLRSRSPALFAKSSTMTCVVLIGLIVLTGHFGGNLTHGDTYLVEYAPTSIRRLAGLEAARDPVTDVGMADPYLDVVQPIFSQRCSSCHNDDKQRGGLNLASLESVIRGGEDGPVIVSGKPDESDLYRRITLPHDDEDFMPAEGKTPLTEGQVEIVRWWIEAGLPNGKTIAELKVSAETNALLSAQLGIGSRENSAGSTSSPSTGTETATADPSFVAKLGEAGMMARQVSQSDAKLIISPIAAGMRMGPEQMEVLAMAPEQVVELSLPRTGITDGDLGPVAKMTELKRLQLENNQITDSSVTALKDLSKLEYLNLYGNDRITDSSIESIAALESLKEVYLWRTAVTPKGIARLRQLRPMLTINVGEKLTPQSASGAG